jgi:hypothetical protein
VTRARRAGTGSRPAGVCRGGVPARRGATPGLYARCATSAPATENRRGQRGSVAKVRPSGPPCQIGTDEVRSAARGHRVNFPPWAGIQLECLGSRRGCSVCMFLMAVI